MTDNMQKVLTLVESNAGLQQKLTDSINVLPDNATTETLYREVFAPVAQEAKIDLTIDDVASFVQEVQAQGYDLSDEALEKIAGGFPTSLFKFVVPITNKVIEKTTNQN